MGMLRDEADRAVQRAEEAEKRLAELTQQLYQTEKERDSYHKWVSIYADHSIQETPTKGRCHDTGVRMLVTGAEGLGFKTRLVRMTF